MSDSITNHELRIAGFRAYIRPIIFLCVFCILAGNSFAQDEEPQINRKYFESVDKETRYLEILQKGTVEQKRTALSEIRNFQSQYVSDLAIPALRDANETVRATAAFAVVYLPKDQALSALAPNLQDKAEIVRRETAYALGKVQNPSAVPLLIRTFQNRREKSIEVKNACLVALGEIGDASAIDFLTQILKQKPRDDDEFTRRSAARAIGQIAQIIQIAKARVVTPENFLPEKYKSFALEKYENLAAGDQSFRAAVPVLIETLQNARESADARREAAYALGAIGDASAMPTLEKNFSSEDYYLAEICKEAVKKLAPWANPGT